jgi:hypothetical protein
MSGSRIDRETVGPLAIHYHGHNEERFPHSKLERLAACCAPAFVETQYASLIVDGDGVILQELISEVAIDLRSHLLALVIEHCRDTYRNIMSDDFTDGERMEPAEANLWPMAVTHSVSIVEFMAV